MRKCHIVLIIGILMIVGGIVMFLNPQENVKVLLDSIIALDSDRIADASMNLSPKDFYTTIIAIVVFCFGVPITLTSLFLVLFGRKER